MKRLSHLAYLISAAVFIAPLAGCQTEDEVDVDRPVNESNDSTSTVPPMQTSPDDEGLQNPDTDNIGGEDVREVTP